MALINRKRPDMTVQLREISELHRGAYQATICRLMNRGALVENLKRSAALRHNGLENRAICLPRRLLLSAIYLTSQNSGIAMENWLDENSCEGQ